MTFKREELMGLIRLHGVEMLVVLSIFSIAWLVGSRQIRDNDFWWHLATGRYIVETGGIPEQDPFSFMTPAPDSADYEARTSLILKGYWLAQIMLYGIYSKLSFWGIVSYKGGLYAVIILFMYLLMRRGGMGNLSSALMLSPMFFPRTFYYLDTWKGERPGHLSFAFAVITVYLLEGIRKKVLKGEVPHKAALACLVLVMPLWANMHGGFLLGLFFICIYMVEIILVPLNRRQKLDKGRLYTMYAAIAALAATAINPNGYGFVIEIVRAQAPPVQVYEATGPVEIWRMGLARTPLLYCIGMAALGIPVLRRLGIARALVVAFLLALSFMAVRHVEEMAFVCYPLVISAWAGLVRDRAPRFIPPGRAIVAALMVVLLLACYTGIDRYRSLRSPLDGIYPFKSSAFILRQEPEGRIFNYYDWGGFLIWTLYPKYRVFTDGRILSYKASRVFNAMRDDPDPNSWAAMSRGFGINTAIVPAYGVDGPVPVFEALMGSPDWVPVHMDAASVVFLRDTGANRRIIDTMAIQRAVIRKWASFYRPGGPPK